MTENTLLFDDELMASGFTQVPNAILESPQITPQAKVIYQLLLRFAWQKDHAFPGQETLCRMMGFTSDNTVRKYLNELRELRLVDWEQRGLNKTNVYTIITRTLTRLEPQDREVQEPQATAVPTTNNTQMNNIHSEPIVKKEVRVVKVETSDQQTNQAFIGLPKVAQVGLPKEKKYSWNRPTYQTSAKIVGTLEDSLRDNLPILIDEHGVERPGIEIQEMAKRCKVLNMDVWDKKKAYVAWVKSKPNEQSRWGLDMASTVETWINRDLASGKLEKNLTGREQILLAGYEISGESNE